MTDLSQKTANEKRELVDIILAEVEKSRRILAESAAAAHDGATHEDAVAKSKYDTHGLELSYLAGSQAERLRLLEEDASKLRSMRLPDFGPDKPIAAGAYIHLAKTKKTIQHIFLSPWCAGIQVVWQNTKVSVVSPLSPLGEALMDNFEGDFVTLVNSSYQECEILAVI
ncbi:MAG: transcription elongation factor [Pseudobacteriovorax sp.]|nr:transcription elongation factor [Pseudobacteriovorax sp.]